MMTPIKREQVMKLLRIKRHRTIEKVINHAVIEFPEWEKITQEKLREHLSTIRGEN